MRALPPGEYHLAQRRLRELLPWARAEVKKKSATALAAITGGSAIGKSVLAYLHSPTQLDAMVIYPAPLGGFHCDIIFTGLPRGIPNSMGSHVQSPLATRREAEEMGKGLLVAVLAHMEVNKEVPGDGAFRLYDAVFPLHVNLLREAMQVMPGGAGGPHGGYDSEARAHERIEQWIAANMGGKFSHEAFHELPLSRRTMLITILHTASLTGVFRHPPLKDGPPASDPDDASQP